MHLHLRLKPRGLSPPASSELPAVEEMRGLLGPTDVNRDWGLEFSWESGPACVKAVFCRGQCMWAAFLMKLKLSYSALLLLGFLLLIFIHLPVNLRCEGSPGDPSMGVCETTNLSWQLLLTHRKIFKAKTNLVDFLAFPHAVGCM